MAKKDKAVTPPETAPETAPDALAQEVERRRHMSYATEDERVLAAKVAISSPAKPEPMVSKLPVPIKEDSRYYPQRFPKHPVNYSELHDTYAEGDTVYCNLADRTFFVLQAGKACPVRANLIETLSIVSPLVNLPVKALEEKPEATEEEKCPHGKTIEEPCEICDAE